MHNTHRGCGGAYKSSAPSVGGAPKSSGGNVSLLGMLRGVRRGGARVSMILVTVIFRVFCIFCIRSSFSEERFFVFSFFSLGETLECLVSWVSSRVHI